MKKLNAVILAGITGMVGCIPTTVFAAEESLVIEEIIVTAQRRSQSIQDVANSIVAVSGSDLDDLNKTNFESYLTSIGGVGYTQSGIGSVKVGIRGVSAITQDEYGFASTVSATGLYLDDVAIQGAGALPDINLYDLDRVEVLKGPQGTLYGEGAMGGAIKMILNKPDLSNFEFKGEVSALDTKNADMGHQVRGAINIPISADKLALRVVASQSDKAGWIDNVVTGEDGVNESESTAVRASLLAQLSDNFSAELLVMHDEQELKGLAQVVNSLGDLETSLLEDEFSETEIDLYALTLKYDFGFAELTSVSSWFEKEKAYSQRVPFSMDEFILPLLMLPPVGFSNYETLSVHDESETLSQEIRLVSAGDERLDWTIGAFYRDRDRDVCTPYDSPATHDLNALLNVIGLGFLAFPPTTFDCPFQPASGLDSFVRTATETFEQTAVYGEVNWEMSDTVELTLGARYFDEEVEFVDDEHAFGVLAFLTIPPTSSKTDDDDVLLKVGINWSPDENQLYYFNIAEGFRSGGSNLNATISTEPDRYRAFESDELINYELGAKTTWQEGRLTLNGTLFYSDWSNIQANVTVPAITTPTVNVLTDGGDAEVSGIEVQLNYLLNDNWSAGFSATSQEAEFTDPVPGANIVKDSALPNAPDLTASGFLSYSRYLEFGEFFAHLEYRYVDEQRTAVQPAVPLSPLYDDSMTILDSYTIGNLTVGLRAEKWYVTAFVQNLHDERYGVDHGVYRSFFVGGGTPDLTAVGTPRTVGLTVGTNF